MLVAYKASQAIVGISLYPLCLVCGAGQTTARRSLRALVKVPMQVRHHITASKLYIRHIIVPNQDMLAG